MNSICLNSDLPVPRKMPRSPLKNGRNVAVLRTIRLLGAGLVLVVVCVPLCVLTIVVGLPAVLYLSVSDSWSQVKEELAASRAPSAPGTSWRHRFTAWNAAGTDSSHPADKSNF